MSVVKPACDQGSGSPGSTTAPKEAGRDLDALFAAGYRRLARLLYRVTGDFGRAEEVASEAFWRLHSKPPAADTNIEGWLYRTGLRLALDQLKKERRRARYEALGSVFGFAASPHQVLEQIEERTCVRQALGALKNGPGSLDSLRAEGLSYSELAAALRLNPGSVGTLLARSEEAFRNRSTCIAMANLQHPESNQDLSSWVKARADLLAPADWEPNLSSARARLEARADDRHRRRAGLKRYLLAGAMAALIACIVVPSIPQTRVFAQQIGNGGWSRVEQFWYWITLVRRPPSSLGRLPDVVKALHGRQMLNPGSPQPFSNSAEAALHAGFTPRFPDSGFLTAPPKLSVLGPMSFAAVIGAAGLSSLASRDAGAPVPIQWDGAPLTLQIGAAITATWPDASDPRSGGTAWSELTLAQCPAPVVTAPPGFDLEAFAMAGLQAAGLRNRDRAQHLARLSTTVPALLFGYHTPYHFVGVREVGMRSASATLIEEFGLAGPENWFGYSDGVPRIERITLLWSLRDRAYLLTGRTVPPAAILSADLAAALASVIGLANTIN